jgi:hypothetical protein
MDESEWQIGDVLRRTCFDYVTGKPMDHPTNDALVMFVCWDETPSNFTAVGLFPQSDYYYMRLTKHWVTELWEKHDG